MTDTIAVDYNACFETMRKFLADVQGIDEDETIPALEVVAGVFNINTYDDSMDAHFASMILRVLKVIVDKTQFEFIKDPVCYLEYCTVICFDGVRELLDWGTSPRGAWFSAPLDGWYPDAHLGYTLGEERAVIHTQEQFKEFVYTMIAIVEKETADAESE